MFVFFSNTVVFQTQCLIDDDDTVVDDDQLEGSVRGEGERQAGGEGEDEQRQSSEDFDIPAGDASVASRTQVCILFFIC